MSTADDDVLATDGGPDDANTRAEFAVLDMALGERFGDRAPRDLWAGTAARLLRARSAAPARMQPWLLAAGMLLGLGVVTAMALWRPGSSPEAPMSPAPEPQDPPAGIPDGPTTLAELQAQLAAATSMRLATHSVWSSALGRWVPVESPIYVNRLGDLGQEPTKRIAAAIGSAQIAANITGEAAVPHWSHRLQAGRAELLVRVRRHDKWQPQGHWAAEPPQVGWMTPQGAVLLQAPDFPFDELLEVFELTTSRTIRQMGMVLGAAGFAAVPTTAKKLQLHEVPATAIDELAHYPSLQSLDLTHAPAWHDATVLQALEKHHLAELALLPDRLDASAFRALGQLSTLRELSLADRPPYYLSRDPRPSAPAASLDDDAMQAMAKLQRVTQLTLAGGRFTDAGLRALRSMQLTSLAMFDCEGMRGESLAELRLVRQLILRGGPLGPTAAAQMAAMPELTGIWLFDAAASIPLAPLAAAKKLNTISLHGQVRLDGLPQLARLTSLRDLMLRPTTPLTDQELLLLHGLRQIETLSVVGATELQCQTLRDALPGAEVRNVW